jgi:hypothetical protein
MLPAVILEACLRRLYGSFELRRGLLAHEPQARIEPDIGGQNAVVTF